VLVNNLPLRCESIIMSRTLLLLVCLALLAALAVASSVEERDSSVVEHPHHHHHRHHRHHHRKHWLPPRSDRHLHVQPKFYRSPDQVGDLGRIYHGWSDHKVDHKARHIIKHHERELRRRKKHAARAAARANPFGLSKAGPKKLKPLLSEKEFRRLNRLHREAHKSLNKKELWE